MQRIPFKQAVGLALVVTSISLIPTAIAQTDPGMGLAKVINPAGESVFRRTRCSGDESEPLDDQRTGGR